MLLNTTKQPIFTYFHTLRYKTDMIYEGEFLVKFNDKLFIEYQQMKKVVNHFV